MTNKCKVIDKINVKNLSFDQNTEANILSLSIKNNTHPKVSIIIPVFNVELYLPQCLDSLLEQVVVDGILYQYELIYLLFHSKVIGKFNTTYYQLESYHL